MYSLNKTVLWFSNKAQVLKVYLLKEYKIKRIGIVYHKKKIQF